MSYQYYRYCVRDREAGNYISFHYTKEEAEATMFSYINQDKAEGIYTPGFYEVAMLPGLMQERFRIGARIAALRQASGMTQAQLAEACGMKAPNIARIETGRYSTGLDILSKIAQVLDCTLDFIEK